MAAPAGAFPDGLGGDPDAVIRQLYAGHARALHNYVARFCPDRASADDIVQETFIRAWRRWRVVDRRCWWAGPQPAWS
jgi:RNA polymerase sigma-70 factor, ECF subfamily